MTTQTRYSLYVLGSAFLSAVAILLTEIAIQFYDIVPPLIATLGNLAGGLFLLLVSAKRGPQLLFLRQGRTWMAIVMAALFIYTLGYLAGFNAIGLIGGGKTALLGQLETVFVVTLAIIFLGEQLSVRRSIAGIFALGGAVLINFDSQTLQLSLSWGELLAVMAPLGTAAGIITLKPLLDRADARWVTGLALLFGFLFLAPVVLIADLVTRLGWASLLLIIVMGMTRGWAWLVYNASLRHIGAARASIIFLSFAFFTVILQITLAQLAPTLGLQLPVNLLGTLVGGVLVTVGIIILQTDSVSA